MKSKSPELHLSKKDIQLFYHVSDSEMNYLIKNKILKSSKYGSTMYSLTEILRATFHLHQKRKK